MRNSVLLIFFGLSLSIQAVAQEPYFIQHWYADPVSNAAMQALDEMAAFSMQSKIRHLGPGYNYTSTLVSGKYPLINNPLNKGSIGLNYFQNQSNAPGLLVQQEINTSLSYSFHYNKYQGLSLGIQGGWVFKKIDGSGVQTGSMYTIETGFDPGRYSGESFDFEKLSYPKIGGSILWFSEDRNRDLNAYLGLSAHGLNQVNGSFFQEESSFVDRTVVIMGGLRLIDKDKTAITPKFYHTSFNGNYSLKLGADYNYSLSRYGFGAERRNNSLNFEFNYLLSGGFQLGLQVIQPAYIVGVGYNMDTYSANDQFQFDNSFEFLLVLRKPMKTPRERQRIKQKKAVNNEPIKIAPEKHIEILSNIPAEKDTVKTPVEEEIQMEEPKHELDTTRFRENVEKDYQWKSVVTLGEFTGIGFDFNSTEIGESAKKILNQLVELVNSDPDNKMVLIGHADAVGTNKVNEKISWERARTVAQILFDMGIPEDRIIIQAKGEEQPIATNETPEGRTLNRRVEFFVIKTE